jgi:hypothetical protein
MISFQMCGEKLLRPEISSWIQNKKLVVQNIQTDMSQFLN